MFVRRYVGEKTGRIRIRKKLFRLIVEEEIEIHYEIHHDDNTESVNINFEWHKTKFKNVITTQQMLMGCIEPHKQEKEHGRN